MQKRPKRDGIHLTTPAHGAQMARTAKNVAANPGMHRQSRPLPKRLTKQSMKDFSC